MNFKFLFLCIFSGLTTLANASQPNVCDQLEEAGRTPPEQITKCRTQIGVSAYYTEKQLKKQADEQSKVKSSIATIAKNNNLETKTFTYDELLDAGFGQPFFATTEDYTYSRTAETTRVTQGDSLCNYLGFEKALKTVISHELNNDDSNQKGLVIDKSIFGTVKAPILYKQDNAKVGVKKYMEITCVKRKDKKLDTTNDSLRSIVEELRELPAEINPSRTNKATHISDSKLNLKRVETTPHGFKTPSWMEDSNTKSK